mmetsp:Transcript_2112/g.4030  ORF Transcript_2112/g.4030 Transcript_2112/m.4030 type:complete len:148 (-) Transcript_2112:383-826(-)
MGKSRSSRQKKKARYDPLKLKDEDGDVGMDSAAAKGDAGQDEVPKEETKGQMIKRHHDEYKQWRLEERDLRRERTKIKKNGGPQAVKEKKRILRLIQDKEAEMKARHKADLARFDAPEANEETETKQVSTGTAATADSGEVEMLTAE